MTDTTIGTVGANGARGSGFGLRFVVAGHTVLLGSRSAQRADAAAAQLAGRLRTDGELPATENARATTVADIVVPAISGPDEWINGVVNTCHRLHSSPGIAGVAEHGNRG